MIYNVLTDLDVDSLTAFQHLLEEMGFSNFDGDRWIDYEVYIATAPLMNVRVAFTISTETKLFSILSAWDGDFSTVGEFLKHYYGEFLGLKHGLN